jgi:UDP-glucose 4-epimerase
MRVTVFDRANIPPLNDAATAARVEWIDGDFTSDADVGRALTGCDVCYHLVSTTLPQSSNADPVFDVETNVAGTIRLLNHAVRQGVKKIVFISSGGTVYGIPRSVPIREDHPTNPICSYGITKLTIEKYLHLYLTLHGLDYTVLRLSNPFGERQRIRAAQGAVAVFMGKALRNEKIEIWGDGNQTRSFLYIDECLEGSIRLLRSDFSGPVNIGSEEMVTINTLVEMVADISGKKIIKKHIKGPEGVRGRNSDNKLIFDKLGWKPSMPLVKGLELTYAWIEAEVKK